MNFSGCAPEMPPLRQHNLARIPATLQAAVYSMKTETAAEPEPKPLMCLCISQPVGRALKSELGLVHPVGGGIRAMQPENSAVSSDQSEVWARISASR